jgi:hypothetical protein
MEENGSNIKPKCVWDSSIDCPVRELFLIPSTSDLVEKDSNVPDTVKPFVNVIMAATGMVETTAEALEAVYLWNWCKICPTHLKRLKKDLGIEINSL